MLARQTQTQTQPDSSYHQEYQVYQVHPAEDALSFTKIVNDPLLS